MALSETRRPRTCTGCGNDFLPSRTALQIDPSESRCISCRRQANPCRPREFNARDGLTSVQRDCIARRTECAGTEALPPCIHGLLMTSTSCKVKQSRGVLIALALLNLDSPGGLSTGDRAMQEAVVAGVSREGR